MAKYIVQRIRELVPPGSVPGKDPDVLIIGPNPFIQRISEHLQAVFSDVKYKVA